MIDLLLQADPSTGENNHYIFFVCGRMMRGFLYIVFLSFSLSNKLKKKGGFTFKILFLVFFNFLLFRKVNPSFSKTDFCYLSTFFYLVFFTFDLNWEIKSYSRPPTSRRMQLQSYLEFFIFFTIENGN